MRRAVADGHFVDRILCFLRRGDVDRPAIGSPGDGVDPVVDARRQPARRAARTVINPQLPEIRFVAWPRLRAPRDPVAIGRVFRAGVRPRARRDPPGLAAADWDQKQIGVRGNLRMLGGVAGIDELLAVRRNIELVAAADGERRSIEWSRLHIARRAAVERLVYDMYERR